VSKDSLRRLRRVTTSGRYFPEIDGLRFIAIFSVICFHLYAQTRKVSSQLPPFLDIIVSHGDRGVRLFFSISGFILALPFSAQFNGTSRKISLRQYFLRRLSRLEPPYLLCLLATSAMILTYKHERFGDLLPHLLASSVYLHNVIYGMISTVNPVSWSLEVEIQFYCAMPTLAFIFALRPHWLRRCALLLAICAVGLLDLSLTSHRLQNSLVNYLPCFLAGMLLADVYEVSWSEIPAGRIWDCIAIPLWVLIFVLPEWCLGFFIPFLLALASLASLKSRYLSRFLRNTMVTVLGGACYSIYLVHFLILGFVFHATQGLAVTFSPATYYIVQASLLVPISVLCGMVYYVLIEQPCMYPDWPMRLWIVITNLVQRERPAPQVRASKSRAE